MIPPNLLKGKPLDIEALRSCRARPATMKSSAQYGAGAVNWGAERGRALALPGDEPSERRKAGQAANRAWRDGLEVTPNVIIYKGEVHPKGTDMRIIVAATVSVSMIAPALAQTQPTRTPAYATPPTMQSAFPTAALSPCYPYSSFNPTSSCYTGTRYPSFSAIEPFEFPGPENRTRLPGSASLDKDQAKLLIEAKGYSNVSKLEKDNRGIWQGKATMKDGRSVEVTLDLEGNIYSEPSTLYIRIERAPRGQESR
jgi:hypothetical protein